MTTSDLAPAAKPTGVDLDKRYEPTEAERAVAAAHLARDKQKLPVVRLKLRDKGGQAELSTDHPEPSVGTTLAMQALGTVDVDFFNGLINQLINVSAPGKKPDEHALNTMLALVRGIAPNDETECMLVAQMAAVHMATMTFARRLAHVENIPQQDSASTAFNKLARTFAVQMEALKRYRTGGEQRVTVQHVTVNEGGQAIVGAVASQPGGVGYDRKSEGQPCASPSGLARDPAAGPIEPSLRSTDPKREAVQVARNVQRPL